MCTTVSTTIGTIMCTEMGTTMSTWYTKKTCANEQYVYTTKMCTKMCTNCMYRYVSQKMYMFTSKKLCTQTW